MKWHTFMGLLKGDTRFDGFVDSETRGRGDTERLFRGDDFTATLDGEHLDKKAHPYDLLNSHLAPGVRKLPSQLDVEIVQALLDSTEE